LNHSLCVLHTDIATYQMSLSRTTNAPSKDNQGLSSKGDKLVDTIADIMLSRMEDEEDGLHVMSGTYNVSEPLDPPPLNQAMSSETQETLVNVVRSGLTFTLTWLSAGQSPDGLSDLVLNGLFCVIGYPPPPGAEEQILETVQAIDRRTTEIAKRLEHMSEENKMNFKSNDMDRVSLLLCLHRTCE
jgi:hypothetical protein